MKRNRRVGKGRDVISDLPTSILHRILSFLHENDSAKTCVLSKQWNITRKSLPVLTFNFYDHVRRINPISEYFDYVDRSLHYFKQHKLSIERIFLTICLEYSEFLPVIDTWLPFALHSGVLDIRFVVTLDPMFVFGPYYHTLPETTFVVNSSLLYASSKFFRLQKLALHHVKLSENIGRDIIRNCPNLTDLDLCHVSGLKTLNISQTNKLETLSISHGREITKVSVDALYLNRFSFELDEFLERAVINLTSCCNLRELELSNMDIADDLFCLYISRFPFLEILSITFCDTLQRIRISLQRLKRLKLSCCNGIEIIEIDAPILSEFEFVPDSIFPKLVSTNIIHGSMKLWHGMDYNDGLINSHWFRKLREDLSSVPFDCITCIPILGSEEENDIVFNIEELREAVIPPLVEVDCLAFEEVDIPHLSRWPALLEGLIWSCHPKTVKMWTTTVLEDPDEKYCIKVFCEMVLKSECLKGAKVESIGGDALNMESTGGIEHKQFRHVLDTLSSIPYPSKLVFGLEWDHSAIL